ncbi:MAG: DUF6088 family protein [Coriobacteriia bacterium]|nr:DUF6088 family protein [Coriobacteriia bacterium]
MVNSRGYKAEVFRRIEEMPPGTVFGLAEFSDVAGSDSVRQAIKALADAGQIERVLRGFYFKPKMSAVLSEPVPPRPDDVARAIARANRWTIAPSGQVALNELGLSEQVPMLWTYVSDGPYRAYSFRGADLRFKRGVNSETTGLSETTLLVIQALKALGREAVGDAEIEAIARRLSDEQKTVLLDESRHATAWVRRAAKQISLGDRRE